MSNLSPPTQEDLDRLIQRLRNIKNGVGSLSILYGILLVVPPEEGAERIIDAIASHPSIHTDHSPKLIGIINMNEQVFGPSRVEMHGMISRVLNAPPGSHRPVTKESLERLVESFRLIDGGKTMLLSFYSFLVASPTSKDTAAAYERIIEAIGKHALIFDLRRQELVHILTVNRQVFDNSTAELQSMLLQALATPAGSHRSVPVSEILERARSGSRSSVSSFSPEPVFSPRSSVFDDTIPEEDVKPAVDSTDSGDNSDNTDTVATDIAVSGSVVPDTNTQATVTVTSSEGEGK